MANIIQSNRDLPITTSGMVSGMYSFFQSGSKEYSDFYEGIKSGSEITGIPDYQELQYLGIKYNEENPIKSIPSQRLSHHTASQIQSIVGDDDIGSDIADKLGESGVQLSERLKNAKDVKELEVKVERTDIKESIARLLELEKEQKKLKKSDRLLIDTNRYSGGVIDLGVDKYNLDNGKWILEKNGSSIRFRFILDENGVQKMRITFKGKVKDAVDIYTILMKVLAETEFNIIEQFRVISTYLELLHGFIPVDEKFKFRTATTITKRKSKRNASLNIDFERMPYSELEDFCELEFDVDTSRDVFGTDIEDMHLFYPTLNKLGFLTEKRIKEDYTTEGSHSYMANRGVPYRTIVDRNKDKHKKGYVNKKAA